MDRFLPRYWLTGCLVLGITMGLHLAHCPASDTRLTFSDLVFVTIWPAPLAMAVIGVRRWDDLKRASCRIRLDPSGNRVVALGHFMEDRWLDIADLHKDTP